MKNWFEKLWIRILFRFGGQETNFMITTLEGEITAKWCTYRLGGREGLEKCKNLWKIFHNDISVIM